MLEKFRKVNFHRHECFAACALPSRLPSDVSDLWNLISRFHPSFGIQSHDMRLSHEEIWFLFCRAHAFDCWLMKWALFIGTNDVSFMLISHIICSTHYSTRWWYVLSHAVSCECLTMSDYCTNFDLFFLRALLSSSRFSFFLLHTYLNRRSIFSVCVCTIIQDNWCRIDIALRCIVNFWVHHLSAHFNFSWMMTYSASIGQKSLAVNCALDANFAVHICNWLFASAFVLLFPLKLRRWSCHQPYWNKWSSVCIHGHTVIVLPSFTFSLDLGGQWKTWRKLQHIRVFSACTVPLFLLNNGKVECWEIFIKC